jgi:hypothetical protein
LTSSSNFGYGGKYFSKSKVVQFRRLGERHVETIDVETAPALAA